MSIYSPVKWTVKESYDLWLPKNCVQRISGYKVAQLSKVLFMQKLSPQNINTVFIKIGIWPFNTDIFSESDFLSISDLQS